MHSAGAYLHVVRKPVTNDNIREKIQILTKQKVITLVQGRTMLQLSRPKAKNRSDE